MNEQSKMALRLTALISALMMSGAAFSAVTVKVPEEIKIVAVDGQELNGGFLSKSQYKIKAGESTLNVRYSGYYRHADNSHDILRSGIVALKTPALTDGETYSLALLQAPKDFDEAQKYKDQPIFGLYNKDHQLIAQQTGSKAEQKNWFSENLFGDEPVDAASNTLALNKAAQSNAAPIAASASNSEQALIQLWKQSSKSDRQKFMAWLAEQSN